MNGIGWRDLKPGVAYRLVSKRSTREVGNFVRFDPGYRNALSVYDDPTIHFQQGLTVVSLAILDLGPDALFIELPSDASNNSRSDSSNSGSPS